MIFVLGGGGGVAPYKGKGVGSASGEEVLNRTYAQITKVFHIISILLGGINFNLRNVID